MNFQRLEYFMVLGRTGNLRRASEILNLSPPALSKSMKVFEDELSAKLWIRNGRNIVLTDVGKRLLKRAPDLIEDFKDLIESLNSTDIKQKPVRIGTFEVFSTYFLSFLNKIGWDNHRLILHELLPGEVEKYLLQGEIDYGITYMPVPSPELDFLKITSIEMGVFTRKGATVNYILIL